MADCPGLYYPAEMRDGLLLRLRMMTPCLSREEAEALGEAAKFYGTATLELTRRGNFQLRGLKAKDLEKITARLKVLPWMADSKQQERRWDLLLDPLTGLDPAVTDLRRDAESLLEAVFGAEDLAGLSPKFSLLLADAHRAICRTGSDLSLRRVKVKGKAIFAIDLLGQSSGSGLAQRDIKAFVLALMREEAGLGQGLRLRDHPSLVELGVSDWVRELAEASKIELRPAPEVTIEAACLFGAPKLGATDLTFVHLPLPLGLLKTEQLTWVSAKAETFGAELRVTPWHSLIIAPLRAETAKSLVAEAKGQGFGDPNLFNRLQVKACVGASGCPRTQAKTREDALAFLAAASRNGSEETPRRIHFCGCAKGCAGREPVDFLLMGQENSPNYSLRRQSAPGDLMAEDSETKLNSFEAKRLWLGE